MGRRTTLGIVCFVAAFLWTQCLFHIVSVTNPATVSMLAVGLESFSTLVRRAVINLIWILSDASLRCKYVRQLGSLESKANAGLMDKELGTVKRVAERAVAARNRLVETTLEKTSPLGLAVAKLQKGTLPDFESVRDNLILYDDPGQDFESLATTKKIKVNKYLHVPVFNRCS